MIIKKRLYNNILIKFLNNIYNWKKLMILKQIILETKEVSKNGIIEYFTNCNNINNIFKNQKYNKLMLCNDYLINKKIICILKIYLNEKKYFFFNIYNFKKILNILKINYK